MVEHKKKSINDYDILKSIGEGAFGKVFLARDKETQTLYAIKALEKQHIVKSDKTKHVYREKEILIKFMHHKHIIKLETTF